MLVLHPSSRCDICLEDYTWNTSANAPHAIACGHIFCLQCLRSLVPTLCPLCRKSFHVDRIKRLHVDKVQEEPDSSDSREESHMNLLMQRIAMVSGENAPDGDVAEVVTEVMEWLESQGDDVTLNRPLRASVDALRRYKAVQEKLDRKKEELKTLRAHHLALQRTAEQDKNESLTVERGLQARALEAEEEFNSKLQTAEAEIAKLRLNLSRYTSTNNPLPPPPQPLPLDRFPLLSRHLSVDSATSSDYPPAASASSSSRRRADSEHALRVLPLLEGISSNPHGYASNGSAHTQAVYIPNGGGPLDLNSKKHGKASREQNVSNREDEHSRSHKVSDVGTQAQSAVSSKKRSTPSQDLASQHRSNQPPRADSELRITSRRTQQPEQTAVKTRVLVPEPEPTKRVYPPRELVPSYLRDTSNSTGRNVYGSYDNDDEADELATRLNLARAHIAGYGQGLSEAHSYSNNDTYPPPRSGSYVPSNDHYAASTRDATPPARETDYRSASAAQRNPAGVAMSVEPAAFPDTGATPRQIHGRLDSSDSGSSWLALPTGTGRSGSNRVTQPPAQTASPTPYIIQNHEALVETRGTHTGRSSMNSSLEFNSSWGDRSSHDSIASLSSLGLPNTVSRGGVRGEGVMTMTSPMFPRELDSDSDREERFPQSQSRPVGFNNPHHQHSNSSHTVGQTPRYSRLQGYMSDDERPRYTRSHSSSYSQQQAPMVQEFYRHNPLPNDLRVQVGRNQPLSQSAGVNSGTPPLSMSHRAHAQTPGDNALALTFQNSPPGSSFYGRRQSPEQIRAPAPRVGGPNVLTSMWR